MRLLHTKELRLQHFSPSDDLKYAILSHTWGKEEVTFQDLMSKDVRHMKGFPKLKNCCEIATSRGYDWVWIDTCCIDKTSSAELSEAINSMFRWYRDATVCYAYLEGLTSIEDLESNRWFTRGWTLQELIAPRQVIFFDSSWKEFGTKKTLVQQISSITCIPPAFLLGKSPNQANIAQRMSWASTRQTTREEDIAYCLMGLFGIFMTPIYGEGSEMAFLRLQKKILHRCSDQTIFLWTPRHEPYNQGLLATSPKAFCLHNRCSRWWRNHINDDAEKIFPYSFLRPESFRPTDRSFMAPPTSYPRHLSHFRASEHTNEDNGRSMIQGSLGSDGVQISLLADYGNLDKDKESSHRRRRLVCLDVLAVSTLFRSQVFLLLDPENEHDFADGFIPYGLGKFRRFVSSDPMSDYMMSNALPHEEFTFKRTKITVSQLITTTCKPGNSKRFNFQLLGLPPLADDIICLGEKDTVVTLPSDTKYYECRGGILKVQHPCSRCNEDRVVLIMFGSREGNLSPWCYISKCPTKESSKSNIMVIYKEMEQRNAGLYQEAGWYLEKCHQRLSVVLSSAKDGNSYDISISCKGDSLVPFA